MNNAIENDAEKWENGELGKSVEHAKALTQDETARDQALIDEAFGLKPISIRLETDLIDQLKSIAKFRGVGYQPLMRQILHRFVESELKQIAMESMSDRDEPLKLEYPQDSERKAA